MPVQPTSSTTLQRPDLGQAVWEFDPASMPFVGIQACPIFGVEDKKADFSKIPVEALLKRVDTRRGTNGSYNRWGFETENDNFACEEHGLEGKLGADEVAFYDSYFDAELINSEGTKLKVLMGQEIRWADLLFDVGTTFASYTSAVANEWSDTTNGDPILDVAVAKEVVRARTGMIPNAMLISHKVWVVLRRCAKMFAALQYTQKVTGQLTLEQVKAALELDFLFVGKGVYDAAKEGQAASLTDVWDDEYALVFYRAPDALLANLKQPTLGRTFLWTEDSPDNATVESYEEAQTRGEVLRVRQQVDEKIIMAELGQLLSNIYS